MAEFTLTQQSALGGFREQVGTTTLMEITGAQITIVSFSKDDEPVTEQNISDWLNCAMPTVGKTSVSEKTGGRILRTSIDRLMILHNLGEGKPDSKDCCVPAELGYQVDQSDYWVMFELSGLNTVSSLERTCRLNLHPSNFANGDLGRTMIEGISAILIRTESDRFLVMSPRPFAYSLAQALATSLNYIAA